MMNWHKKWLIMGGITILMISLALYANSLSTLKQAVIAYEQQDYQQAETLFQKMDINESVEAQYYLGMIYAEDLNLQAAPKLAIEYLKMAAKSDFAPAQFNLGLHYYRGLIVEKNQPQALKLWYQSAKQNYSLAQYYLGLAYFLGEGVQADALMARRWYQVAADNGNSQAKQALLLITHHQSSIKKENPALIKDKAIQEQEYHQNEDISVLATDNNIFKGLESSHYIAQLFATSDFEGAVLLKNKYDLNPLYIVTYQVKGKRWFALLQGNYLSKQAAMDAVTLYTKQYPSLKPWIRPISHIQQLIQ